MLLVNRTQGPECLKGKKKRTTGKNNPQASTTFLFIGPPQSVAALKNLVQMDIVEFTPLQINSDSMVSMPLYHLCVQI